ncbi:hypothetical protein DSECCO2_430840 [anaerobic digester metagenome]
MDVTDSGESRRGDLGWCLGLIGANEIDLVRTMDGDPPGQRTPEEVQRECNAYRQRAHRTFGFPCPGTDGTSVLPRSAGTWRGHQVHPLESKCISNERYP